MTKVCQFMSNFVGSCYQIGVLVMVVSADNQNDNQTHYFQKSFSTENFETFGLVRKYMNGAIYIESPVDIPKDCGCDQLISKHDEIPIKRISCSCTSVRSCKIHENEKSDRDDEISRNYVKKESKAIERKTSSDHDFKVSTVALSESNELLRDEMYKKWILKKNEEKKRIEENKIYLQEMEEEQKQKRLEQERENFRRWLSNKKKEEEKRKLAKEKELEKAKIKEAKKERRNMECKLRYQLWLKRKEQEELEKKLKEQMEILKITDERQRRIEDNEKAFQSWLESSKNKPKPIPSSQGLDSMRSSVSVTYINPVPWSPNIEDGKPTTQ